MSITINITNAWVACKPADFRKSIDGLCEIIVSAFDVQPTSGVFIFFNRNKNRVKMLVWHGNGFILLYKRLESGKFTWPKSEEDLYVINDKQSRLLLAGVDWITLTDMDPVIYDNYY